MKNTESQNWYNLPVYYDVSFSHEMREELQFLKKICQSYRYQGRLRLLEPACGTGRLLAPLVKEGFDCTGLDINPHSLRYLKDKLQRHGLHAKLLQADMSDFMTRHRFDIAFCTVDTFRHLLTEQQALAHLQCMARALRPTGIYVLGMHLLTDAEIKSRVIRWQNSRGRLTVKTAMSLVELDRKKRRETLKVVMQPITNVKKDIHVSVYDLRTYTLSQFHSLLVKSGQFRLVAAYGEYYDLESPLQLNERCEYAVFILQRI